MNKLFTFLILSIFICSGVFSQTKEEREALAKQTITELKDGALLIRLQSKNTTIELLKERGYPKRAAHIEKQQLEENKAIAKAFGTMDFTKVYFFYSEYSEAIIQGDFEGKLLDTGLNPIKVDELSNYVVGAIGPLPKNYEYEEAEEDDTPENVTNKKTYKGGSDLSVEAFYLMDKNLELLPNPFPQHQRYHPIILTKLTHKEVAEKMNEKLVKFYDKVVD